MQNDLIKIIGLYLVKESPEITLVELLINKKPSEIEIVEFTQIVENQPRLNWQAPFCEKYLNIEGNNIIGDEFNLPKNSNESTRLTFFFYFLDLNKPLITPFGNLELIEKTNQPERISKMISFENP